MARPFALYPEQVGILTQRMRTWLSSFSSCFTRVLKDSAASSGALSLPRRASKLYTLCTYVLELQSFEQKINIDNSSSSPRRLLRLCFYRSSNTRIGRKIGSDTHPVVTDWIFSRRTLKGWTLNLTSLDAFCVAMHHVMSLHAKPYT